MFDWNLAPRRRIMTSVMTFDPIEERRVGRLAAPPVRLALAQARTTPVLALERPDGVEQLVAALPGWTLTDRQSTREVALQLGPAGMQQHAGAPETVWVLSSADGQTRAAVSASSVAVETDSYADWDFFGRRIQEVLQAVQKTFAPARCVRFGMRYVNEVDVGGAEGDPVRLETQLNAALLGPALALRQRILGSLTELRVAEGDDAVFALRHGLVTPGTYLLDYDAYREAADEFDAEALIRRAEQFHARIESVFAWSMADSYLDELRRGDQGQPQ
jgi:uncharacterized protein (TIGR04255 family)